MTKYERSTGWHQNLPTLNHLKLAKNPSSLDYFTENKPKFQNSADCSKIVSRRAVPTLYNCCLTFRVQVSKFT